MNKILFSILLLVVGVKGFSQLGLNSKYPKSLASYSDFKNLVNEVESHREKRLIDFNTFLKMSKEENVIVLDSRSAFRFERKHLKGAIHLDFSDFTQEDLLRLIPDPNTKILIYCNNNFIGDQVDFMSKVAKPVKVSETELLSNKKSIMLALNIPTYLNLYGYGYKNVYELNELVSINDERIHFSGSEVK